MNRADSVYKYLGFATRAGKLATGAGTLKAMAFKKKVKLVICGQDVAENTRKKAEKLCHSNDIEFRVFGDSFDMSKWCGKSGKGLFLILDQHFANILKEEIDQIQSERKVF